MKKIVIIISSLLIFAPNIVLANGLADSPWPVFHGNSKLTGQSKYDTSKVDGTVKWKFKAESGTEISPAIGADGTIYFADHACKLYAIDQNGKEKWRFDGGEPIYSKEWNTYACAQSSPAIAHDGTIYALMMTGSLFAVTPEGKEKWRAPVFTFKDGWSSPAIASDGTIYISSEPYPSSETGKPMEKPGYVYAFNPDGSKKWERTNGQAGGSNSVAAIADDGTLFLGTSESPGQEHAYKMKLFAFNPEDGSVKWRFWFPNGVMEGSVAIGSDGSIYFGTKGEDDPRNANFYALTPDGKEKWKIPLSMGESITPGIGNDGTIYFGDWGGWFYAVNPNGEIKWKVQIPESEKAYESLSSSPAIGAEGTLYFGSIMGIFFAYTKDGQEKWRYKNEGGGIMASPAIGADGTVYVTTVTGELIAFGESKAQTSNQPKSANQTQPGALSATVGIISGLLIMTAIVLIVFRQKTVAIFFGILSLVGVLAFGILYFNKPKIKDTNQDIVTPSRETSQEPSERTDCPHHIYGTWENGFYGVFAFENKIRDLTTDESKWIQQNCSDTSWPKQYRKESQKGVHL